MSQPDSRRPPPHRASGGGRAALRPRVRTAVRQLLVLRAFYEASTPLDAPRHAFPARSKPIGPKVSKNEGS